MRIWLGRTGALPAAVLRLHFVPDGILMMGGWKHARPCVMEGITAGREALSMTRKEALAAA